MQILSLRHSWTHLPPTLHIFSPPQPQTSGVPPSSSASCTSAAAPSNSSSTRLQPLLAAQVSAVAPEASQPFTAARGASSALTAAKWFPVAAAASGCSPLWGSQPLRSARNDRSSRRTSWGPKVGSDGLVEERTYRESIFNVCLGLFLSIILFSEEWLHPNKDAMKWD